MIKLVPTNLKPIALVSVFCFSTLSESVSHASSFSLEDFDRETIGEMVRGQRKMPEGITTEHLIKFLDEQSDRSAASSKSKKEEGGSKIVGYLDSMPDEVLLGMIEGGFHKPPGMAREEFERYLSSRGILKDPQPKKKENKGEPLSSMASLGFSLPPIDDREERVLPVSVRASSPVKMTPYEDGEVIKILIKGRSVPAITAFVDWNHNDGVEAPYSQQKVRCQAIIDDELITVEENFVKAQRHPYILQAEREERDSVPLTEWGRVYKYEIYKRPDGSPYKRRKELLFESRIKEEMRPKGQKQRVCKKEWREFTQGRMKTRHRIEVYDLFAKYQVIEKRNNGLPLPSVVTLIQDNIRKLNHSGEDGRCDAIKEH
jgi:hypothetical protein